MSDYTPPTRTIEHVLGACGLPDILALAPFHHLTFDDVVAVLLGFGRFAREVIAPSDQPGDREGATLDVATGEVTTPPAVAAAFQRWVADGWPGLGVTTEHGGGGFPSLAVLAAEEMFASANMALSLNPMLTHGAIRLLEQWGSAEQRATILPKLVRGDWAGTMNLTEPDAGSDVGAVRTIASRREDGQWELTGTKIFITWGDHDLTENIVHLVLARTSDAPKGTKGISLFAVLRNLIAADGRLAVRNRVRCVGLERKLGIHASPTCVLEFDRAVGELVGPERGGMEAMFTMMNAARLSVGIQGLAVTERAYQQAHAFASQRRQGRTPSTPRGESALIIEHPDVRRMLMLQLTAAETTRLLLYTTAAMADFGHHHPDPHRREEAQRRARLLTPIAKSWATDEGVRMTSLALQVHGGMGYIEDTGVAQRVRDARIAPIYEGTNGIQAIDLVVRKVRCDGGATLDELLRELQADAAAVDTTTHVFDAIDAARQATAWMAEASEEDGLAGATPFLNLVAIAICGGLYARFSTWLQSRSAADAAISAGRFRFFAVERAAGAPALVHAVTDGADRLARRNLGR